MDLKPVDIVNKTFSRKVRGYDSAEVEEFLKAIAEEIERGLAENAELRERMRSLEGDIQRYRELESTLNGAILLAQKTAEDTIANAHKEAELIIREAREGLKSESDELRRELEDLQRARERFAMEFRVLLTSCLEVCERSEGVGRTEQSAE